MNYRDLEKVRSIVHEAIGLEITYAYDDLVFPDNTAFIIQYDDKNETNLFCYFHKDCNEKGVEDLYTALKSAAKNAQSTISSKGRFELFQKGEQVEIKFL